MAALTAQKPNPSRGSQGPLTGDLILKMKASTTIYAGALVVVDGTTGLAEPATAAASKRVAGVAQETKTSDGSTATYIRVRRGVFKFANKGGDLVTVALTLTDVYIEDDQTVRLTATGSSRAGKLIELDSDGGVWVETY